MIYMFEVSIRAEKTQELQPVYLFYKPQETPLELRKSIDGILASIRKRGESTIYDRIYLADELNKFFDKIKILMLGIPFEPQKLEGTGIQVLVFRIPNFLDGSEVNILAIADSEDSPIAVRRIIKKVLTKNKDKLKRLVELSLGKNVENIPSDVLDIYNELDFRISEVLRTKIRKIKWAEKAKLSAGIFGTIVGLSSMFLLTALVMWIDSIYGHFITKSRDLTVIMALLIILATGFFTGFVTGWSKWIKLSAPLVSIIGTTVFIQTLFREYIIMASQQLALSPLVFTVLVLVIMAAVVLLMYFISFAFGYYLVETRALTPPKMRIFLEKRKEEGAFWRMMAFLKRLS